VFTTFIDWLNDLPKWFQMVFASGLTFMLGYSAILIVRRGLRIVSGGKELDIGGDGVPGRAKAKPVKSPHAMCPHSRDVVTMLNQTVKLLTRKLEIRNVLLLRGQMSYAEERGDQLLLLMQGIYIDLLKRKSIQHATLCDSFNIYRLVLVELRTQLLREVRNMFREHPMEEFDEVEFRTFSEGKVESLIALASSILNDLYFYAADVTREELFDANMEQVTKIQMGLREILYHARKVSQTTAEELRGLDREMEKLMSDLMGE